jgi:hypothetical protein
MKYRVLWLEDESDKMDAFFDLAYQNGIELIQVDTFADFKNAIEKNSRFYFDAIILDALGLIDNSEEKASTRALEMAKNFIFQHKANEVIPYFILSAYLGKAEYTSVKEMLGAENIYIKTNDEKKLLADLKLSADKKVETQIRHKHQEIFSIFSLGYLPTEIEIQVLELIKAELPVNRVEIKSMLSNIRSIHESCLLKLEAINVVPDASARFSDVLKHLSGNKTAANNWQSTTEEYQNDAIENLNKWLYFTCGKYIHNLRDENYNDYMISKSCGSTMLRIGSAIFE